MLVFCKEQTTTDAYFNSFFLSGINWCADFQPIGLLAVYRFFSCQPVLDDSFSAIDTSIQWTAGKTNQEIFLYILSVTYLCTDAAGAMDFNINQKGIALICFYLKLCSEIFFDAFSLLPSSVTAIFFLWLPALQLPAPYFSSGSGQQLGFAAVSAAGWIPLQPSARRGLTMP